MSKKLQSQISSVADSHGTDLHTPDAELHDAVLPDADRQRRNFLRNSISTAVGVAIGATAIQTVASAAKSAGDTDAVLKTENKDGYRLTKHIADYYKSAAI